MKINSIASSFASSLKIANSRRVGNNEQYQRPRSERDSVSHHAISQDVGGRRSSHPQFSTVTLFEYVCPFAGCSLVFYDMAELRNHHARNHVVKEDDSTTAEEEESTAVHLPSRRHHLRRNLTVYGYVHTDSKFFTLSI